MCHPPSPLLADNGSHRHPRVSTAGLTLTDRNHNEIRTKNQAVLIPLHGGGKHTPDLQSASLPHRSRNRNHQSQPARSQLPTGAQSTAELPRGQCSTVSRTHQGRQYTTHYLPDTSYDVYLAEDENSEQGDQHSPSRLQDPLGQASPSSPRQALGISQPSTPNYTTLRGLPVTG